MWNVMWSTMLCIATMATFQVRHYSWPFILLPPRDSPTSHKGSRRRYKDPAQDDSSITPLKNDLTCVAGTRPYLRSYFWMTDDTGISWWRQFDVAQLPGEGYKVSDLYCIRGIINCAMLKYLPISRLYSLIYFCHRKRTRDWHQTRQRVEIHMW